MYVTIIGQKSDLIYVTSKDALHTWAHVCNLGCITHMSSCMQPSLVKNDDLIYVTSKLMAQTCSLSFKKDDLGHIMNK